MRRNLHLIFAAGLLAATTAFAQAGAAAGAASGTTGAAQPGFGGRHHGLEARFSNALGLTADQQTQLQQMHADLMAQIQPMIQDLRTSWKQLKDMTNAASPDATAIGQKVLELKSKRDQIRSAHQQFESSFRATLTPDQQTKFDAIRKLRGERHDRGFGMWRGGPPVPPDGSN